MAVAKQKKVKNRIIQRYISKRVRGTSKDRGRQLLKSGACKLITMNTEKERAEYEVISEYQDATSYIVVITGFNHEQRINTQCSCPYDWGGMCKHEVAALYHLETTLGYEEPPHRIRDNDAPSILYMKTIDELRIKSNVSTSNWIRAKQLAASKRATMIVSKNRSLVATVLFKRHKHKVTAKKVADDEFHILCDCNDKTFRLCVHSATVLLQVKQAQGANAFELMRDWDTYKNDLLAPYGFTVNDDLTNKFTFKMNSYKPELIVLDPSITKINALRVLGERYAVPNPKNRSIIIPNSAKKSKTKTAKSVVDVTRYGLAYVFNFHPKWEYFPFFEINPVIGKLNDKNELTTHITPMYNKHGNIDLPRIPIISTNDLTLIQLCKDLYWDELGHLARANMGMKTVYTWSNRGGYYVDYDNLKDEEIAKIENHTYHTVRKLFLMLSETSAQIYMLADNAPSYAIKNLQPIKVVVEGIELQFTLFEQDEFIVLQAEIKAGNTKIPLHKAQLIGNQILLNNNTLYLLNGKANQDMSILNMFAKTPMVKVKKEAFPNLLNNLIIPLKSRYNVDNQIKVVVETESSTFVPQIYLKEAEDFLVIQPLITYGDKQVELDGNAEIAFERDGKLITISRNQKAERDFKRYIITLHHKFALQEEETEGFYYYVHYDEVMENNWFLDFYEAVQKQNIAIFGFKTLNQFRYNVNKPEIYVDISSGIDWFDISAGVNFGSQVASLRDVQQALIRKEKFVKLNDGTLGVLPQKWLERYATLFKMATIKSDDTMQISKVHFSLVDELYQDIDQDIIRAELDDKRRKLKQFKSIEVVNLPKMLTATLRPYQKSGFNWFNFLDQFKWGGILADDMGLGKTLQVLSFFQYLKENNKKLLTNLVVVPTSLLYNWEAEVKKFCPDLRVYRHHGPKRERHRSQIFKDYDIILTSYGIITSDIKLFVEVQFSYVVLDESQAIKNPTTKRYKAVRLLKANNRLALTGTPVENNTFDLFAQLNFLNPGMLGSLEFFKREYATPIDKHSDEEKAKELRKIVYPFILRRTKKMVATDLPEKTETVLYCEMGKKQRKVYETFRDNYRFKIIERINEEGMQKAGMYILEGLMKLRQICDSPALLTDAEDYGSDSVKLDELIGHIKTKTGNHKILVFSQFLGMLAMIRKHLEKKNIDYEYLDGSISPMARQKSVDRFQSQTQCRVFLISLKAGGVGLNLTAADYVYLIDPWWNPAVEAQAIDRTHRIGQKKRVFAYKMICKNTVEEKILNLQEKKKALAADIISTESGFLKKLKKSDVEYLFT